MAKRYFNVRNFRNHVFNSLFRVASAACSLSFIKLFIFFFLVVYFTVYPYASCAFVFRTQDLIIQLLYLRMTNLKKWSLDIIMRKFTRQHLPYLSLQRR